jgi:hypothetical protein
VKATKLKIQNFRSILHGEIELSPCRTGTSTDRRLKPSCPTKPMGNKGTGR